MTSLTFIPNGSAPIAKITSSTSEKYVYLSDIEANEAENILDEIPDDSMIQLVCQSLKEGLTLRQLIDELTSAPVEGVRSIEIKSGEHIYIVPAPESERVLIGGESGCGKSTLAALYAMIWKQQHPNRTVHLFARQEDDPAFEHILHEEIVVNENILDYRLDLDDFEDSLVIFDDMDNLQDKKVLKYVHSLVNDLMTNGRKKNIWVVYLTHILLNGNQTKIVLNESNKVVFFNGGGKRQNINFLKTYAGMQTPEINLLTTLESRWVCLSRKIPRYVIHEKGIFLI